MSAPVLQIILGSTRPGRNGAPVAEWVPPRRGPTAGSRSSSSTWPRWRCRCSTSPAIPASGNYVHQHTKDWSATVTRGDAFVFVVPEYNHSFNAATKNALDYLHTEWADKAVGIVSYGGVSAGTRAMTALKPVLSALRMVPVTEAVNIPFFTQFIDDDGVFHPNEVSAGAATAMLDEIARLTGALRPLRAAA